MAQVAEGLHNTTRAASLHSEALTLAADLAEERKVAQHLEGMARIAVRAGAAERAVRLLGAADVVRKAHPPDNTSWRKTPREQAWQDRAVERAQTTLGDKRFAAAFEAGRTLAMDEAVTEAQGLAAALGSESG
jgi:hypothetical protein